jgi:CelD/BcsL family acetyltransferase involved in cellulose biosynthesis
MSAPKLIRYETPAEFRGAAESWNDLWRRSLRDRGDLTPPSVAADSIGLWLEHFAPRGKFVALAVEQGGQLIAGLPLVEQRMKRAISVGSLPANNWCWAGDLLVDPAADANRALEMLALEVKRLPWPLLWFEVTPLDAPRWQKFLAALKFAGNSFAASEKFRIGKVEIEEQLDRNWEAYQAAWSGNHRRHMRKALRRANEEGGVELDVRRPTSADEVDSLLLEAFEVEHRSWKGSEQTSVLSNPSVWSFYRQQAAAIASEGQLEIAFLRYQGKAIAFEYGWHAGGVYYTPKVGYDDAFGRFSPGQLLRVVRYEKAFAERDLKTIDFYGPLAEATSKWATCTYPVSRLVVETGGSGGRALLWAYQNLWGSLRKWRRRDEVSSPLEIVQIERKNLAPLPS